MKSWLLMLNGDVLNYLSKLYANHPPQFIYYLTLFNLFREFLDGKREIDETLRKTALPDTHVWQKLFFFPKGRGEGGH